MPTMNADGNMGFERRYTALHQWVEPTVKSGTTDHHIGAGNNPIVYYSSFWELSDNGYVEYEIPMVSGEYYIRPMYRTTSDGGNYNITVTDKATGTVEITIGPESQSGGTSYNVTVAFLRTIPTPGVKKVRFSKVNASGIVTLQAMWIYRKPGAW